MLRIQKWLRAYSNGIPKLKDSHVVVPLFLAMEGQIMSMIGRIKSNLCNDQMSPRPNQVSRGRGASDERGSKVPLIEDRRYEVRSTVVYYLNVLIPCWRAQESVDDGCSGGIYL